MSVRILEGDARQVLAALPDASAQCCVTSPPYFGLRDYGHAGQIGLEPTPDEYVAQMVAVFREVRRVLREDGTLWLNIGDSYAGGNTGGKWREGSARADGDVREDGHSRRNRNGNGAVSGCKPKDLLGIPWRVAFALQADGWTLRSDIVWSKPNPMPESVTDRPTKSHEMVFLFSKAKWIGAPAGAFAHISDEDARWLAMFIDTEGNIQVKRAEREGRTTYGAQMCFASTSMALLDAARGIIGEGAVLERAGKNAPMYYLQLSNRKAAALLHRLYPFLIVKRRQARIAMHLQTLLRNRGGRAIDRRRTDAEAAALESLWLRNKECNRFGSPDLADVAEPKYGKWTSQRYYYDAGAIAEAAEARGVFTSGNLCYSDGAGRNDNAPSSNLRIDRETRNARTVWPIATQPYKGAHFATMPPALAERCIKAGTKPGDTVLDPFGGAGTTGLVADRLGRDAILCELNPAYADLARQRIKDDNPLLTEVA